MAEPPGSEASGEGETVRARSAVVNVLVAVAAGIAASGGLLRGREIVDAPPGGTVLAHRVAMATLLGLVAVGYATLRVGSGRSARFRIATAIVGALAVPLGLAHGWWVDPAPGAIAPFWVAALGLGCLAYPRGRGSVDPADEEGQ